MPTTHEQNANGPMRSQRIEEKRRAFTHIINIALMIEIMVKVKQPTSVEEALVDPS